MLQKSKSTTTAKFKFLIIIPLMTLMLTYVACSEDQSSLNTTEESLSVTEQIAKLEASLENKEQLTEEEKIQFLRLLNKREELLLNEAKASAEINGTDVPFSVIDEVPIFDSCEDIASNEDRKKCTSQKISEFVNRNFDIDLPKKLGLTGIHRIIVQFKIDKQGNITEARGRAAKPELEEEAERVINNLPTMMPGKQNGKAVGTLYSLPIVFQVSE